MSTVVRDPLRQPIEFTEYYSPDGTVLRFDTRTRFLVSEVGYGMPPIRYIDQSGPFQHGKTIYDYRLEPRTVQVVFRENACSREDLWGIRANILNILRPNRQLMSSFALGTLRKVLPDGARRDLSVIIEQGPEFRAREVGKWDEWSVYETIRFIAPDPTFYDPTLEEYYWQAETTSQLVFPFTFDSDHIIFADDLSGLASFSISYTGTWAAYPRIVITGPLQAPIVRNYSTNEKIDLSATSILAGEKVTIDLQFGRKTITSTVRGNMLAYLSSDSDLATFHIAPEPEAVGGVNNVSVEGAGAVSLQTSALLSFNTRFIGI